MFTFAQTNTVSILFDGVSDSISVPHNTLLNPTTAITIEAWIKAINYGTNVWSNYIVGKDDWNPGSAGYALRCGNGGQLSFNISSGSGLWKEVISSTTMPTNVWTHVAATFDGTTMNVYINGVNSGSLSYTGTINPSMYNLNIGSVPYTIQGGRLFSGNIDQVELWNIALTPTQINQYKACPPLGTETGLIAFWNFEEGGGTIVHDLTSHHFDGTLYNNPTWSPDAKATTCGAGINTITKDNTSVIYPNPANDIVTVKTSQFTIGTVYYVVDNLGRQIVSGKIYDETTKIDISKLVSGVYMLQIGDVDLKTYKIIKN